ncbi:hypothetical protein E2C01_008048 [Portunus trituberculatus]|uniref:Uncharacterized protein n=1 Tax=Portunus trituberculatus TaxID=210409 RepID=A0A5B7CZS2_PORTR|nr:hypothetical protein [Portunus trituberculatus]
MRCNKNQPYLEGLIEEILHTLGQSHHKAKWITNNVQTKNQHIQLLHHLALVVSHHLLHQLIPAHPLVLTLHIGKNTAQKTDPSAVPPWSSWRENGNKLF